jgi:hypothetical protein
MAESAYFNMSSVLLLYASKNSMPMLAMIWYELPANKNGSFKLDNICWETVLGIFCLSWFLKLGSDSIATNSSPPRRPDMSPLRRQDDSRG